jgi:hypothetical protein
MVIRGQIGIVDAGIAEGGAYLAVAKQALDGRDLAAGVEQLGGTGVAQAVR